jgi:hypothetical protein
MFDNFASPASQCEGGLYTMEGYKQGINGPAITHKSQCRINSGSSSTLLFELEHDTVHAIPFYNASILPKWSSRARNYDWPSKDLIHEISDMEGFILPIGEKQSETEHIEWRISYVTAERTLVQNLNSTQHKLYVLLKLFSKHVFAQVSKSFSSYMVKNVVLWMAEINSSHLCTPSYLIDCLIQSLNFIKCCLICNHLPSYIMPKKNLIAGRIYGHEKHELIAFLSSLIDEGAYVIYRLPKLAACLNYAAIHPEPFANFGIWRHCVETQLLLLKSRCSAGRDPKFCLKHLFKVTPVHLGHIMSRQDRQLPNLVTMIIRLTAADYLERFPNATLAEIIDATFKRIKFVNECCFLC